MAIDPRLADRLSEPLLAVDAEGGVAGANAAFQALETDAEELLPRLEPGRLVVVGDARYQVELVSAGDDLSAYSLRRDTPRASCERALARYLEALDAGSEPLEAALEGLCHGAGWRWAFVTRFNPKMLKQVQVIHWAEHGSRGEPFDYAVAGTPCERVFGEGEGTCRVFHRLGNEFPDDPWIRRNAAQEYVGQVYRTREGVPLGHLFTVADTPKVGCAEAEAVVRLLGHLVTTQLQALSWGELVDHATRNANRDPLTGVASRFAYEQALEFLDGAAAKGDDDLTVVWFDLDGMKSVNDTLGHGEGDRMLVTFAHHMTSEIRARDSLFRVGGDEFVLFLQGDFERRSLALKVDKVAATLESHGFADFAVSYGAARVAETEGDLRRAIELADKRMYEMKRLRRRLV